MDTHSMILALRLIGHFYEEAVKKDVAIDRIAVIKAVRSTFGVSLIVAKNLVCNTTDNLDAVQGRRYALLLPSS